jgi:hypothetical protein
MKKGTKILLILIGIFLLGVIIGTGLDWYYWGEL